MGLHDVLAHIDSVERVIHGIRALQSEISRAGEQVCHALSNGGKVILFGNGGSAADSQHIAAEFTGRFVLERSGLPAIAFTTDTSVLTAISNDYGYERVFARQVEALGFEQDIVIAISTSGNSQSVIEGVLAAKAKGMKTIGLSGRDGGKLKEMCDIVLTVPSDVTAHIQVAHIMMGHIICEIVDEWSATR